MVARKVTDDQIQERWKVTPSVTALARHFDVADRVMSNRVQRLRSRGIALPSPDTRSPHFDSVVRRYQEDYSPRLTVGLEDGHVLIGSDPHYQPGVSTVAHRAFIKFCADIKPRVVVMNGDLFDGSAVSRWPRIGWEQRPTVVQELKAVKERLDEVEKAFPGAERIWSLGNHDARYELRLAQAVPEYEGVMGFTLKEHFPLWKPCWSIWVNDTVIKHRFKSGVHAAYNSTMHAGRSLVHGHLHSLKVYPFTDYNGTRYGVDAGTLAEPFGSQFEGYMEDSPRSWRSGFVLLTFHKGRLLIPEMVSVFSENQVEFRGKVYEV